MSQAHISKWGNSLAVRLPGHLAKEAKIKDGTTVELKAENGSLVVTPVRKKFKLSELLAQMPENHEAQEFDWGEQEGEEVW